MKDYRQLRLEWDAKLMRNSFYKDIMHRLNYGGKIKPEEIHELTVLYSESLSDVLKRNIRPSDLVNGKLPQELANTSIAPLMRLLHERVDDASYKLQLEVNKRKKIGTKPLHSDFDAERVEGILNRLVSEYFEDSSWLLVSPIENFGLNTISSFCAKNMEASARAGVPMGLTRKADTGACPWCLGLVGEYDYPAPKDVYRRHENCRCVTYTTYPKGTQDVWSKQTFDKNVKDFQVADRIRELNEERDSMRQRQQAWRKAQLKEVENASTMKELIDIGKRRGYRNPQGWAYHQWKGRSK